MQTLVIRLCSYLRTSSKSFSHANPSHPFGVQIENMLSSVSHANPSHPFGMQIENMLSSVSHANPSHPFGLPIGGKFNLFSRANSIVIHLCCRLEASSTCFRVQTLVIHLSCRLGTRSADLKPDFGYFLITACRVFILPLFLYDKRHKTFENDR